MEPQDVSAAELGELSKRVAALEWRLALLERRVGAGTGSGEQPAPAPPRAVARAGSEWTVAGAFPAIGRLFLGIAGGFVLRGFAEAGAVPRLLTLVGVVYAAGWLVWAARGRAAGLWVRCATAVTGMAVFCPLVWETTVRFRFLSPGAAATAIGGVVALAVALAADVGFPALAYVAAVPAAFLALGLLAATGDAPAFTAVLLWMAALMEFAWRNSPWRRLQVLVAIAVDFDLLVLTLSYAGRLPGLLLTSVCTALAIFAGGMAVTALWRRRSIAVVDYVQVAIVLALTCAGFVRAGDARVGGALFLALAAGCYLARDGRLFAWTGTALAITGAVLAFPRPVAGLCLSCAAVAVIHFGWRRRLGLQALIMLGAAGGLAGAWSYGARILIGQSARLPGWSFWCALAAVALCAAMAWHTEASGVLSAPAVVAFVALAALSANALGMAALVAVAMRGHIASVAWLASLRTLTVCVFALGFGLAGKRSVKMAWLAYVWLALCTLKLVCDDLPHGTVASLAVSVSLYGGLWLTLPHWHGTRSAKVDMAA